MMTVKIGSLFFLFLFTTVQFARKFDDISNSGFAMAFWITIFENIKTEKIT